jgi:hypothetical protein
MSMVGHERPRTYRGVVAESEVPHAGEEIVPISVVIEDATFFDPPKDDIV